MILVSSAVGSNTLVAAPPLRALDAQLCPLASGDVSFIGNGPDGPVSIGVEVKELGEFITSLFDGRVQGINGQLRAMCAAYDYRYLCYYGMSRCNPVNGALQVARTWPQKGNAARLTLEWIDYGSNFDTNKASDKGTKPRRPLKPIKYGFVERFLVSPSFVELGVTTKHAVDVEEAAIWLAELYEVWQKPYSEHRSMHTFHVPPVKPPTIKPTTPKEEQIATTAFTLPGVGWERAWALSAKYSQPGAGGLRALFNAGPAALAEVRVVDGKGRERRIGNVVANAVEEAIT